MEITGSCFCGNIKYHADVDESLIGICHCRDCQIFSGSAFRLSCLTKTTAFSFFGEKPSYFAKVAESGNVRRMAFCGNCGTHLCSEPENMDDANAYISIRLASADQFDEITPKFEAFCESRVDWLDDIPDTKCFSRSPGSS